MQIYKNIDMLLYNQNNLAISINDFVFQPDKCKFQFKLNCKRIQANDDNYDQQSSFFEHDLLHVFIKDLTINDKLYKNNLEVLEAQNFKQNFKPKTQIIKIDTPFPYWIRFKNTKVWAGTLVLENKSTNVLLGFIKLKLEFNLNDDLYWFNYEVSVEDKSHQPDISYYIDEFDKIKNHRPKATHKLELLGDILTSTYKLDTNIAINMWTYIYELNHKEGEKEEKFYSYTVFNKIKQMLSLDDAYDYLIMNDKIMSSVLKYSHPSLLITNLLERAKAEEAARVLEIISETQVYYPAHDLSWYLVNSRDTVCLITYRHIYDILTDKHILRDDVLEMLKEIDNQGKLSSSEIFKYIDLCLSLQYSRLILELLEKQSDYYPTHQIQTFFLYMLHNLNNDFHLSFDSEKEKGHLRFITELICENKDLLLEIYNKNCRLKLDNKITRNFLIYWIKHERIDLLKIFVDFSLQDLESKHNSLIYGAFFNDKKVSFYVETINSFLISFLFDMDAKDVELGRFINHDVIWRIEKRSTKYDNLYINIDKNFYHVFTSAQHFVDFYRTIRVIINYILENCAYSDSIHKLETLAEDVDNLINIPHIDINSEKLKKEGEENYSLLSKEEIRIISENFKAEFSDSFSHNQMTIYYRDLCVFLCLFVLDMHPDEIINLNYSDINFNENTLNLNTRIIHFNDYFKVNLKTYTGLQEIYFLVNGIHSPLFISKKHARISYSIIQKIIESRTKILNRKITIKDFLCG